ncbi:2-dehydropantoate 2-reductase [Maribacter confluentis]|uniref:2-dehydropantoate 2-reductase n=1 Tax=Maribacter confluentis TaxID=1656093 RepID=A0ABT8RNB5_9FLAO|nr:2-dehydropantoate 2-reductase [Maribacter confluentis]MDO1512379.1 2-dehydropantoate 2-reductase [Maribacter confluentis]
MKNTEIYIIGSGAIGKALAVFLKRENKQVKIIRGSIDNIPNITTDITVVGKDYTFKEKVVTTTFSNLSSINGIVLITTKTFGNTEIAKKLNALEGNFVIILLQNGLNIERPFKNFNKVYRCVLLSTSQVTGENEISFKTVSASPVGNLEGQNEGLDNLIREVSTPKFEFREESNISKYVWTKVIANCVFNTICPLLEIDNGIFHRDLGAKHLAEGIIEECVSLAKVKGIHLDSNEVMENLILISQKSDGQLISTYMDILNKRQTEIESLNLEIAKIADEVGHPELVKNTRILGQLILIKSNLINYKSL